jgi:hypothetical protein
VFGILWYAFGWAQPVATAGKPGGPLREAAGAAAASSPDGLPGES